MSMPMSMLMKIWRLCISDRLILPWREMGHLINPELAERNVMD